MNVADASKRVFSFEFGIKKLLNLRLVFGPGSMPREQEAVNFTASGGSLAPFVDLSLTALIHLTTKN